MHSHLGVLGVTGFLMQDLKANPLDYVEGGPLNKRRVEISEWLDATNPDLSAFYRRGRQVDRDHRNRRHAGLARDRRWTTFNPSSTRWGGKRWMPLPGFSSSRRRATV